MVLKRKKVYTYTQFGFTENVSTHCGETQTIYKFEQMAKTKVSHH